MISANYQNLVSFIPQYLVATLAGFYVFSTLRKRRFYNRPEFILVRSHRSFFISVELIGMSFYTTVEAVISRFAGFMLTHSLGVINANLPGSDLRTEFRKGMPLYPNPEYVKRNRESFKAPSTRVRFPEVFYRKGVYDAYTSLFPIAIWAGVLLLLTPYQKIFIFIPHFSSLAVNLSIIIVLSITIFEGTIASLFLFIGTTRRRVITVMLAVIGVFSLSLLTPSFNWFHTYTLGSELLIFSILGILILSVTFLISLFQDRSVLFRLGLYSSMVSYVFFISVTSYNLLLTIIPSL